MAETNLMRGTKILTVATLASKILGFIYVVPFSALVGQTGLGLYSYGYTPYTILLSLATLGFPLAVSKFVSKYQSLGDYETGYRLFKSGLLVMSITGLLAFLLLFFMAPVLTPYILPDEQAGVNSYEDIIFTIRMVSVALLIVPIMGMIRGYFQGCQSMMPTAVSQVIEQIVRIAFILSAAFLIMNVQDGDIGLAVGFATFGAFVGGLAGLAVLLYFLFKNRTNMLGLATTNASSKPLPLKSMYKELIWYAIPLSIVGLAIPLFQLIDTLTINGALAKIGMGDISENYVGVLTQSAHKIVLIPMALATALSVTLVPTITNAYTSNDSVRLQKLITQTFQLILFITLPAAVGLAVLANPIFVALFGLEDLAIGGETLRYYGPITLFFSLFSVTAAILQGINRQLLAITALLVGLVLKLALNNLLLLQLGPNGAILATYIGFSAAIAITIWGIGKHTSFSYQLIIKRAGLMLLFALIMATSVWIIDTGLRITLPLDNRLNSFILSGIGAGSGAVVYAYLAYRSRMAEVVLGARFKRPD
ncbi:putative polysaccharide biosynthesis protein [Alkalicoccobacillus murimartini]|uniref:O-antigen/teichoic acid export membrane protein n=1 Tax=Alkalicoccobacillus murimartini TaxID=171685 RepID=A0ABT9YMG0_9BACI|nr:polysaccharide biosynthesis protein [Alkalicoccobacillus murimartini]MDQ0208184.1 O-antigen/teichoic acid export membrane protein [Alkalicoccobacillus murimartini]